MMEALYTHNTYHNVYDSRQEMQALQPRMGFEIGSGAAYLPEVPITVLEPGEAEEKMIVNCLHCGSEFYTKPARIKGGRGKYCSKSCYYTAIRVGKETKKRVCRQCGVSFYASQQSIDRGHGKFCSHKCHGLSIKGKQKPLSERRAVQKTCEVCGILFTVKNSDTKRGHGHFCSKSCMGTAMRITHKGNSNPAWKGGISFEPYCPRFTKEFKERVRAFFDHKCVECGASQNGSKLPVHHVNFRKDACCAKDVIPLFVPLCPSCHSKTQFNRPFWQYWFTEMINHQYGGKCYLPKVGGA